MDEPRYDHQCQPLDELRVRILIHVMRPYLLSSPLPPGNVAKRIPKPREAAIEKRIRELEAVEPRPRKPPEPEPWWPVRKGIRVPPAGGHL